ncbi:MAG: hypothetical protein RJA44_792 [Pseudomonadota bacterium]
MTAAQAPDRQPGCELCLPPAAAGSTALVAANALLRIVRVLDAPAFPAFYRVIWNAHHAELSDLAPAERHYGLDVLVAVEQALRARLAPDKINLASLGNVVPHLHWHVIGRWRWDSHFPQPIWGTAQRADDAARLAVVQAGLPALDAAIAAALAQLPPPL